MGKEKKQILILHGWGLTGNSYGGLKKLLEKKGYRVFSPDLPGFGEQKMLKESMDLSDYVDFVRGYIKKHKLIKPVVIAHSFGGRIALRLEAFYPNSFEKMILTGVPIIRHKGLKMYVSFVLSILLGSAIKKLPDTLYKKIRKVFYFIIGEWDYYKAGSLSQTFKNVVGEDLIQYAKKIEVPTLLIWGKLDRLTPASDLQKIVRYIRDAHVYVDENHGHSIIYENPKKFVQEVEKFL